MVIRQPRFVLLDTGTINYVADNPGDSMVNELEAILLSGDWIPFLTYHHLEEIACHGNQEVFTRRIDFLRRLPHVACLKKPSPPDSVGDSVYLRDYEIEFVADHPGASHRDVIAGVAPKVRSGFYSGEQIVDDDSEWWDFFRMRLAEETRRYKAEIANLTHFPMTDVKKRIPAEGQPVRVCSSERVAVRFRRMADRLAVQIQERGDCRNIDPVAAARDLMKETFDEVREDLGKGGNFFERLLERYGISRERLPTNATIGDVEYEGIFVAQMSVHARRLLRNKEELLRAVRKEQLPSWFVWQDLDRRSKQLPRAEIGNVNDKHIVGFGPYVDVLNVDKRIADLLRQGARHHELVRHVYERVPAGRGLPGLLSAIRQD